ncbi:MAG: transport protein TonB [Syntrophaceae bacterium PtaU1.Bin231]|nr:MAG: transport protein TonB [Syntrophaceae bacterium PtaU1.Bin231]
MAAAALSVLAHLGAAVLLYAAVPLSAFSLGDSNPRVIHVTWVHPADAPVREAAPARKAERRTESQASRLRHPPEAQKVAEPQPQAPVRKETTEESPQHADTGVTAHFASPPPPAGAPGHANRQVASLSLGLKTDASAARDKTVVTAKPRYGENARPHYPLSARLRGHEGVVVISAEVLAEGRVGATKIKASSGHDSLDRSALEAVKQWKFEPGRRMGRPVKMWVDIPVRFLLTADS